MPPHTHMRRSEVYLYFNLEPADRVIHLMGPAHETRHIVVANKQVGHLAWLVNPCRGGYRELHILLGHGRRKPGLHDMDPLAIADLL